MAPFEKQAAIADIKYFDGTNAHLNEKNSSRLEGVSDSRDGYSWDDKQASVTSRVQGRRSPDVELLPFYESDSHRRVSVQLPPMQMMVRSMLNHKVIGGKCKRLITGGVLQDEVKCIIVSTTWFHTLFEGQSRLVLTLYNDAKEVKKRVDIFGSPPKRGFAAYRYFGEYDDIVALARPGCYYQLEIKVAKGQVDALTLAGLVCKIIPSSTFGQSFNFIDEEGAEGRYRGEVNAEGMPNGRGIMDYQDGASFVGKYNNGHWDRGVKYFGNEAVKSMKQGEWDDQIDMRMTSEFDYNLHFFVREKKLNIVSEEIEEKPRMCGALSCFS